ncbi:MAG TPA: PilZ domain-containing protein [Spirochaetota bacterium]|nr:PilZ domain-containing protein [Spirochaetota bacterium]
MSEKREYKRHQCFEKIDFDYFEGNPDEIDISTTVPVKCKGHMLDLGRGGAFIVTDTRVAVNMPVRLRFRTKKSKYEVPGTIIRTGLLKNNPSEITQKYAAVKVKEDAYIAIQFAELIEEIDESVLKKS